MRGHSTSNPGLLRSALLLVASGCAGAKPHQPASVHDADPLATSKHEHRMEVWRYRRADPVEPVTFELDLAGPAAKMTIAYTPDGAKRKRVLRLTGERRSRGKIDLAIHDPFEGHVACHLASKAVHVAGSTFDPRCNSREDPAWTGGTLTVPVWSCRAAFPRSGDWALVASTLAAGWDPWFLGLTPGIERIEAFCSDYDMITTVSGFRIISDLR